MTETKIQCPHCGTVADWQIDAELAKHLPVFTADFFDRLYLEWQFLLPYAEDSERVTLGTYMHFELAGGRFPNQFTDQEYILKILKDNGWKMNRPNTEVAKEDYERFKRG